MKANRGIACASKSKSCQLLEDCNHLSNTENKYSKIVSPCCSVVFHVHCFVQAAWRNEVKASSQSQRAEYQLVSENKALCTTVANALWDFSTSTCQLVQLVIKLL